MRTSRRFGTGVLRWLFWIALLQFGLIVGSAVSVWYLADQMPLERTRITHEKRDEVVRSILSRAHPGGFIMLDMDPWQICKAIKAVMVDRSPEAQGQCNNPPSQNCNFFGKVITQEGLCLCFWLCDLGEMTLTVVTHCD